MSRAWLRSHELTEDIKDYLGIVATSPLRTGGEAAFALRGTDCETWYLTPTAAEALSRVGLEVTGWEPCAPPVDDSRLRLVVGDQSAWRHIVRWSPPGE